MKFPLSFAAIACACSLIGAPGQHTNPPPFDADLYHKDKEVFSLHVDFLFWRAQEGALDYALEMKNPAPTPCFAEGDFQNATFSGDPGFRVAASFFRAPKYWEVWGIYTRMTSRGSNSASKPDAASEFLTGTWPQIFTDPVTHAHSDIHVNYNVADLLFDRVFFPNPHLRLRLIGGGSAAWMDQFWKILYVDEAGDQTKIGNRWKFIGGGLKAGALFDWYWFGDIYMVGGTTFGAFLGSYHNKAFQTSTASTPSVVRDAHFQDIRPSFTTQFYVGPSYEKNVGCSRLEFFVGYEFNAWFNLQEVYRSTSGAPQVAKETWMNTGLFALQGLTARLTVDF